MTTTRPSQLWEDVLAYHRTQGLRREQASRCSISASPPTVSNARRRRERGSAKRRTSSLGSDSASTLPTHCKGSQPSMRPTAMPFGRPPARTREATPCRDRLRRDELRRCAAARGRGVCPRPARRRGFAAAFAATGREVELERRPLPDQVGQRRTSPSTSAVNHLLGDRSSDPPWCMVSSADK